MHHIILSLSDDPSKTAAERPPICYRASPDLSPKILRFSGEETLVRSKCAKVELEALAINRPPNLDQPCLNASGVQRAQQVQNSCFSGKLKLIRFVQDNQ